LIMQCISNLMKTTIKVLPNISLRLVFRRWIDWTEDFIGHLGI
jgi:hypothetical protein